MTRRGVCGPHTWGLPVQQVLAEGGKQDSGAGVQTQVVPHVPQRFCQVKEDTKHLHKTWEAQALVKGRGSAPLISVVPCMIGL